MSTNNNPGNLIARIRSWWQGRVAPFGTRTYEDSREALGDRPWKEVPKSTDAWYVLDPPLDATLSRAESRRRQLRFALLGTATVPARAAVGMMVFFHRRPTPPAAVAIAPPVQAAAAPVEAPAPPAPAVAVPVEPPAAAPEPPARHTRQHARSHHKKA